jgi:hypothetical protein
VIIKNNIRGSDFWVNSELLSFPEIQLQSRVPSKWLHFDNLEPEYKDRIIKPINRYVSNLYPKPRLKSIDGNQVTLTQETHAEIWVKLDGDQETLYALDKTWQRQFYPSINKHEFEDCFKASYRFYVPWFINRNIKITFLDTLDPASPFRSIYREILWSVPNLTTQIIDTPFVDFGIKKTGSHMQNEEYGIIPIGSPMYDIVIQLEQEDIEKIREEYEQ